MARSGRISVGILQLSLLLVAAPLGSHRALASPPTYCSSTGTPLQTPVVEGGSFGFSVSVDAVGDTIGVGQPDAEDGRGLMYVYNQVALCAFQSYDMPIPTPTEIAAASGTGVAATTPGMMGMMTALSRDGKWMAVAGNLEADNTMAQVYIYRRQSNDSSGGFTFHQKLLLQPAPAANAAGAAGKVYAGSLSISREGRLVLVSWSVYGEGMTAEADDPYGPPSSSVQGSAQLYRRNEAGHYSRAQADLSRLAPPYAKTQFFGANSYVVADGAVIAVSTRVVDRTRPNTGAPAIVIYRRTPSGAFELLTTLKTPGSDGTFVMTESGSHLAVVRDNDIHMYVREGDLGSGKTVYNKRCTLISEDMTLEPTFTKMAITVANNVTMRLAISNSLDTVFLWSIPLGGKRAYKDGTCPATLDRTLTGESGSQFGAALAMSENGNTLVVGVPGSAKAPDAAVLVVDIAPPKAPPPSPPPGGGMLGGVLSPLYNPKASSVALDNTYFVSNPSSVLVSARRGSVGVPAASRTGPRAPPAAPCTTQSSATPSHPTTPTCRAASPCRPAPRSACCRRSAASGCRRRRCGRPASTRG
ncbi:MAG: hypothetical protein J3K34DRAFT_445283, partial [Monoraphidium minutum]